MGKLGGFDDSGLEAKARGQQKLNRSYSAWYTDKLRKEGPEKIKFLEYLIESLDYDVLLSAFKKVTGLPEAKNVALNNAVLKNFVLRPVREKGMIAFFDPTINTVGFADETPRAQAGLSMFKQHGVLPEKILFEVQLYMIHEMTHALGRVRVSSKQKNNQRVFITQELNFAKETSVFRDSARKRSWPKWKKIEKVNEGLNEGTTQRIAEEVFLEYARVKGHLESVSTFLRGYAHNNAEKLWTYSLFMNHVDEMCENIARYLGRDKDSVWKSFKRGYVLYGPRYLERSAQLYKKVFGNDFWESQKRIGNDTPIADIAIHDATHFKNSPQDHAQAWLKHLGIAEQK